MDTLLSFNFMLPRFLCPWCGVHLPVSDLSSHCTSPSHAEAVARHGVDVHDDRAHCRHCNIYFSAHPESVASHIAMHTPDLHCNPHAPMAARALALPAPRPLPPWQAQLTAPLPFTAAELDCATIVAELPRGGALNSIAPRACPTTLSWGWGRAGGQADPAVAARRAAILKFHGLHIVGVPNPRSGLALPAKMLPVVASVKTESPIVFVMYCSVCDEFHLDALRLREHVCSEQHIERALGHRVIARDEAVAKGLYNDPTLLLIDTSAPRIPNADTSRPPQSDPYHCPFCATHLPDRSTADAHVRSPQHVRSVLMSGVVPATAAGANYVACACCAAGGPAGLRERGCPVHYRLRDGLAVLAHVSSIKHRIDGNREAELAWPTIQRTSAATLAAAVATGNEAAVDTAGGDFVFPSIVRSLVEISTAPVGVFVPTQAVLAMVGSLAQESGIATASPDVLSRPQSQPPVQPVNNTDNGMSKFYGVHRSVSPPIVHTGGMQLGGCYTQGKHADDTCLFGSFDDSIQWYPHTMQEPY